MKKTLILVSMLLASSILSKAQNAITTYTLTPYAVSTVNVSTTITTSNGQSGDYPVNYAYPIFTRDSIKVQFWNASSGDKLMAVPDSIQHFWTGSHQFGVKDVKGIDSFYHAKMLK